MYRNYYNRTPEVSRDDMARTRNYSYAAPSTFYTGTPDFGLESATRIDRVGAQTPSELGRQAFAGPSTFNTGTPDHSLESAIINWFAGQNLGELGRKLFSPAKAQMLDRCYSIMRDIEEDPLGDDEVVDLDRFYSQEELCGAGVVDISVPGPPTTNYLGFSDDIQWPSKEKGAATLAFICKEGVMVAVEHPVAGKDCIPSSKSVARNFIVFNSHVIGCVTGEIADCETFLRVLPHQGRAGSAAEVSNWVGDILSSCNLRGLSGILIAGWDETGPSLYCLDGGGKLLKRPMFACGSCSQLGVPVLIIRRFWNMRVNEAAKFARAALRTALIHASENGDFGGPCSVYYVGAGGWGEVFGNDGDILAAGT